MTDKHIKLGNKRLLKLATYVERRQRAKPKKGYDQKFVSYACGAPACLLGHAERLFWRSTVAGATTSFFALTMSEWGALFGMNGCDNAGTDWRKAVAFVREFVANRGGV